MIKTLLRSLRDYRKVSLLAPFFILVESALFSQIPFLIAKLIDTGINTGNISNVLRIGLILVSVSLLMILTGVLGGIFAAKGAAGFAKNLRHDVFYKIQDYSFSNIDKFSSSSLIVRLTTDIQRLQVTFQMFLRLAFRAPSILIFSSIMAFSINHRLSLVFLYVIPFVALFMALIIKMAFPRFQKVFKEYDDLNKVVQENLEGIRTVKAYVREDEEIKKFKVRSSNIEKMFVNAYKLTVIAMPFMLLTIFIINMIIIIFGSRMVISSDLTTGDLVGLINYVTMAMFSLIMLSVVFVTATVSLASAKRVVEVLEEEPSIQNKANAIKQVSNGSIKFEDVNFSYLKRSDKLCLNNINIDIRSGERIGIIGSTGSGKSTLINLISRLYDVDSGKIKIAGKDIKDYDLKALRNNIAYVPQKSVLFSGTIEDNLKWGNENSTFDEMDEACEISQIKDFIYSQEDVYSYHIEQGGVNLSGGQRQRLCIARAVLKNPKIIIFDDSTSAVDMATESKIRKAISDKLPSMTQLIIAQRIVSVWKCNQIIVLDKGFVVGRGTHEELIKTNSIYKEVFETQMREINDASI